MSPTTRQAALKKTQSLDLAIQAASASQFEDPTLNAATALAEAPAQRKESSPSADSPPVEAPAHFKEPAPSDGSLPTASSGRSPISRSSALRPKNDSVLQGGAISHLAQGEKTAEDSPGSKPFKGAKVSQAPKSSPSAVSAPRQAGKTQSPRQAILSPRPSATLVQEEREASSSAASRKPSPRPAKPTGPLTPLQPQTPLQPLLDAAPLTGDLSEEAPTPADARVPPSSFPPLLNRRAPGEPLARPSAPTEEKPAPRPVALPSPPKRSEALIPIQPGPMAAPAAPKTLLSVKARPRPTKRPPSAKKSDPPRKSPKLVSPPPKAISSAPLKASKKTIPLAPRKLLSERNLSLPLQSASATWAPSAHGTPLSRVLTAHNSVALATMNSVALAAQNSVALAAKGSRALAVHSPKAQSSPAPAVLGSTSPAPTSPSPEASAPAGEDPQDALEDIPAPAAPIAFPIGLGGGSDGGPQAFPPPLERVLAEPAPRLGALAFPKRTLGGAELVIGSRDWLIGQNLKLFGIIKFLCPVFCLFALVSALAIFYENEPKYFAVSDDFRLLEMKALTEPHLSSQALLNWTTETVCAAMSLDFLRWREKLMKLKNDFTVAGFASFVKALESGGHIHKIETERLTLSAIPFNAPIITSETEAKGKLVWTIEIPTLVSYESSQGVVATQKLLAEVVVERVKLSQNPKGVVIRQLILSSYSSPAAKKRRTKNPCGEDNSPAETPPTAGYPRLGKSPAPKSPPAPENPSSADSPPAPANP
ncbi:MAG: DotI/IcmL/TraM family protein [Deltaproteobacteria bacterium]|nr:DotI/IcmL/TraM family protein [Deltaproteobacteria bacterium]